MLNVKRKIEYNLCTLILYSYTISNLIKEPLTQCLTVLFCTIINLFYISLNASLLTFNEKYYFNNSTALAILSAACFSFSSAVA